mmetsp:Transcript_8629/g.14599  ORF Transcript_8629/g.14599 Transcript_8629/m.14599 type:complete len:93 (-) Transcript_8629:534-812(-)
MQKAVPLVINVVSNIAHILIFKIAFYYADLGGLNKGIIQSLNVINIVLNCISFYIFFGEKQNSGRVFGIFLAIVSVMLLSLHSLFDESRELE